MAQNFVKALETVSPSVPIVEMQYGTAMADAGAGIASVIQEIGDQIQQSRDLETSGNFYGDLEATNMNIERLRDESELQRLEAIKRRNEALYDRDDQNDAVALEQFNRELERINSREQQQGIVLDSNKRALIRRWMSIRPDLTEFFNQALTLDKKIGEMRAESATATSNMLTEYESLTRQALANGTTVGMEQIRAATLRRVEDIAKDVEVRQNIGKLQQKDFDDVTYQAIHAEYINLFNQVQPLFSQAIQGDARAVNQIRFIVTQGRETLQALLIKEKVSFEKNNNVIIDTQEIQEYIDKSLTGLSDIISTADVRSYYDIKRMMQEKETASLYAAMFPWLPPRVADDVGRTLVTEIFKNVSVYGRMLSDPSRGLPSMAAAERAGSPEGQMAMSFLRLYTEQFAKVFNGSPLAKNSESVVVMNSLFTLLQTGQPIPDDIARAANPIINNMLSTVLGSPSASPEIKGRASNAIVKNTVDSYNTVFGEGNIFNPNSTGSKEMKALNDAAWASAVQPIANDLVQETEDARELFPAITFDPNRAEPFGVSGQELSRIRGRVDAPSYLVNAIKEMNKYYRMVAATRPNGKGAANKWANEFLGRTPVQITQTPAQQAVARPPSTQAPPQPEEGQVVEEQVQGDVIDIDSLPDILE